MRRFSKRLNLGLFVGVVLSLVSCVPSAESVISPRFKLLAETSGLATLNSAATGDAAVFKFDLEVINPNAFSLRFAGIDGAFFINDQQVAEGFFPATNTIPAARSGVAKLEFKLFLSERSGLLSDMAELVSGAETNYRLVGTPVLSYFGLRQVLPQLEVFSASLSQPLALDLPAIIFDSSASRVSEASNEVAVIDVALRIVNDSPLGFNVLVPELVLELDGETTASKAVLSADVGAFSEATKIVRFELATATLNIITANEIRRLLGSRGSLGIGISGEVKLELAGIASETFERRRLVSGFLK